MKDAKDRNSSREGAKEPTSKVPAMRGENSKSKQPAKPLRTQSEHFASATLDALSAHLSILDETGTIIAVNQAWRDFAQANSGEDCLGEGANYLTVCDAVRGRESDDAKVFASGIRSVLNAGQDEFIFEYPCHSPIEKRWFIGRVTRFLDEGAVRIVVAHENITARKLAEEALREKVEELRQALDQIKTLRGFVPICASCKKIRDDKGYWEQVEIYIHDHTEAEFSHSICPECVKRLYPEFRGHPE